MYGICSDIGFAKIHLLVATEAESESARSVKDTEAITNLYTMLVIKFYTHITLTVISAPKIRSVFGCSQE